MPSALSVPSAWCSDLSSNGSPDVTLAEGTGVLNNERQEELDVDVTVSSAIVSQPIPDVTVTTGDILSFSDVFDQIGLENTDSSDDVSAPLGEADHTGLSVTLTNGLEEIVNIGDGIDHPGTTEDATASNVAMEDSLAGSSSSEVIVETMNTVQQVEIMDGGINMKTTLQTMIMMRVLV